MNSLINNVYKKLTIIVILLIGSNNILAATTTSSFTVTATVAAACTVAAANLPFGNFTNSADVTVSTSLTVSCTNGTVYNIGLGLGSGSGTSTSNRIMTNTATSGAALNSILKYNLYLPDTGSPTTCSSYATVWVPATSSTQTSGNYYGTGNGSNQTISVCGKVPLTGNSGAYIGSYTDVITVTLFY